MSGMLASRSHDATCPSPAPFPLKHTSHDGDTTDPTFERDTIIVHSNRGLNLLWDDRQVVQTFLD